MLGRQVQLGGSSLVGRFGFDPFESEADAGERVIFVIASYQENPRPAGRCKRRSR